MPLLAGDKVEARRDVGRSAGRLRKMGRLHQCARRRVRTPAIALPNSASARMLQGKY